LYAGLSLLIARALGCERGLRRSVAGHALIVLGLSKAALAARPRHSLVLSQPFPRIQIHSPVLAPPFIDATVVAIDGIGAIDP
jgi:hypothetical protein